MVFISGLLPRRFSGIDSGKNYNRIQPFCSYSLRRAAVFFYLFLATIVANFSLKINFYVYHDLFINSICE
ncbi:hypothetical protein AMJ80_06285 [bacterium SM23_31]|nr:MAG: hypothetical protein AMJ80_06285 [bacterium SM23_31]